MDNPRYKSIRVSTVNHKKLRQMSVDLDMPITLLVDMMIARQELINKEKEK